MPRLPIIANQNLCALSTTNVIRGEGIAWMLAMNDGGDCPLLE
jgi:hypothetical protein